MTARVWKAWLVVSCGLLAEPRLEAQSLSLRAPSTVPRGEEVAITLEGTTTFEVTGFVASLAYESTRLACTGQSFAESVWRDSDFRTIDDSTAGTVRVVAVEDTTNSGSFVPAGANQKYLDFFFEAKICTGPTVVSFRTGLDDNIVVDHLAVGHDVAPEALFPTTVEIVPSTTFVRGNANNGLIDGSAAGSVSASVTLSDAIFILADLFGQGRPPPCLDAGDANNDGRYDIVDPVTILQFLFNNTAVVIPEPFEKIGLDVDGLSLGCETPPPVTGC